MSHRQLFILRMWPEANDAGQAKWRGHVQCADDGATCAFHDWPELIAFLSEEIQKFERDNGKDEFNLLSGD